MTLDHFAGVDPTSDHAADTKKPASRRKRLAVVAIVVAFSVLAAVLALGMFVVSTYEMQGSSMFPTYESGDRVWVNRLTSPDVGDVVVVQVGELDGRELLKRVVAGGGDTIEMSGCQLRLNGTLADVMPPIDDPSQCGGDFEPVAVPEGHVFLLGDNLAASQDSRQFGPVPVTDVVGVAFGS